MSSIPNTLSASAASKTGNAYSSLTSEEFVKIMFSELSNQDPLKPNDSNALLQQMANLRSIESDLSLQTKLTSLVSQNEFASASGLIGQQISGVSVDNARVGGTVASVLRTSDGPVITLKNGERVAFKNIDQVAAAPAATTGAPNNGTGSGANDGNGTGNTGGVIDVVDPVAAPRTPRGLDASNTATNTTNPQASASGGSGGSTNSASGANQGLVTSNPSNAE